MFSAALGSMINPIIIGYLMDRFTPKDFVYITFGQSMALLLMSWIATFLSWYVKRYTRTIETEIPINGEIPN
jgi:1,4-dihydroxy-2-naphthoate octaprenyltransferase